MRKFKSGLPLVALQLTVFVLISLVSLIPFIENFDTTITDQLHSLRPREEIVIVGIDDQSLEEFGAWPWDRSIFADGLETILADDPAVVGFDILFLEERSGDDEFRIVLESSKTPIVLGSKFDSDTEILSSYLDGIEDISSGYVNFYPSGDGKIRGVRAVTELGTCEQHFSTKIFSLFLKQDSVSCEHDLVIRNNEYSMSDENDLWINYSDKKFPIIPFNKISSVEPATFTNKIVLIGSTEVDIKAEVSDTFTGISGDTIPGVEIHANVINNFLQDGFLSDVGAERFVFALILYCVIMLLLYKIKSLYLDGVIVVLTIIGILILALIAFEFEVLFPISYSVLSILFGFIALTIYQYSFERRQKTFIKNAFGQYMNPALLSKLIEDPETLRLGGQRKEMSILFSDIRGFTTISESLSSEELVEMINTYLDYMSEIIINHDGTIDKYIGDAIMAFWNAPLDNKNHAESSVMTAIEMLNSVSKFNTAHPEYPEIAVGIGINTDEVVVGNVGGRNRFDYTVLGDGVNTASRLEGLTKQYGVGLIVSESTKNQVSKPAVSFRKLDVITVKGKTLPITIFEPYLLSERSTKQMHAFEEALSFYLKGQFSKAEETLEKLKDSDSAAKKLLKRIKDMTSEQRKNWQGVWRWDKK